MARASTLLVTLLVTSLLFAAALMASVRGEDEAGFDQLTAALHHYDTLHSDHVNHSYSSSASSPRHRHVQFHVLGRHFHLSLVPNSRLFSRDFGAHVVGEDGEMREVPLNKEEFYHGHVHGDQLSSVSAHISESGVMTASIITSSEVYHIEPSRHYIKKPHPFHMIAYKSSHVKDRLRGHRMDYVTGPTVPTDDNLESDSVLEKSNFHSNRANDESGHNRLKRQSVSRLPGRIGGRACPMILVADFTLFERLGNDERSVLVQLVQLMDSIDRMIYRSTGWIFDTDGRMDSDIGIEIRNVTVHSSASSEFSSETTQYNRVNPGADANDLLGYMRFGDWGGYCLAHLFTDRNFASGLLGLANIASPLAGQTGGICSIRFRDFGFNPPRNVTYNTGLTTFNNNGETMLMSELIRVTGHELGHNWGSHHDPPGDPNCRDRWLMNEFAQDGSEETHMRFSVCSRVSIGQVLLSKGTCFNDPETCGNFEVDAADEECDAGPEGDACCNRECRLVQGAVCSDLNQACCRNCSIADTSVVCREVGRITINCTAQTNCSGESPVCPSETTPAEDGTPCIGPDGGGVCRRTPMTNDSECLSMCTLSGLSTCTCDQPDECRACCRNGTGPCRPAMVETNGDVTTLPLSNGVGCNNDMGVCVDGVCTDTTQDVISRIWDIIVNLDINAFGVFVSENIVGFVLIFTIPLWCTFGCIIECCVNHDGYVYRWVKRRGLAVKEEVDVDLWFMDRLERYYRRLDIKTDDDENVPLLSRSGDGGNNDSTGSSQRLLEQPPETPVDDTPAPIYRTYIDD